MGRDYANREMTMYYDPETNALRHEDEPDPHSFTVAAKGTAEASQPYEMRVTVDGQGITIDGMRLSWNEARAAFDVRLEIDAAHRALFGVRGKVGKRRT